MTEQDKKEVDLYDPKFVHFEWDESLKGNKGFYSDGIHNLKEHVNNYEKYYYCNTEKGEDPNYPYYPFAIGGLNRTFFYYDPNYEIKWAYFKEGKTVQLQGSVSGEWSDVTPDKKPSYFDDRCVYRIKPEEESKKEPKLDVNVDVNIKSTSEVGSIKIQINGKEVIFKNAEEARLVLGIKEE